MKPKIYIAGKIASYDFRHDLIPNLRDAMAPQAPLDCGGFIYTGPFFISCDHSCLHGPTSHGVGLVSDGCEPYEPQTHAGVWTRNARALRQSSAVFAYIESDDAYGTLVEIGQAQALGIPVWVLFGPKATASEMWYAAQGPGFCAVGVTRAELPNIFSRFLRRRTGFRAGSAA
jgi:hypothetical protein